MSKAKSDTVLITGASAGIGRATALYMAERGYSVIGTSRSAARLEELESEASRRNLSFTAVELDINSEEAVGRELPRIIERHGTIDVLVNNAGYGLWGPVESLSLIELRAQFETNLFAAIGLIKAVVPAMVREGRGTIINVSSILGRMGTPFNGGYAATKFALEGISESLRVELGPLGVRVAVVEPGLFRTDFLRNQVIAEAADSEELPYRPFIERYRAKHSRFERRLATDPIKVAEVIHKIARSRRPAFRHPVGLEARLGILGARLLPERLFHAMLSRATMK